MGNTNNPERLTNLAFFKAFLNMAVDSYPELSKRIGVSTTAIHHWFRCDDVRISQIIACANALGYHVYISISDVPMEIMPIDDSALRASGVTISLKNLHFLTCALKEQRLTKLELAKRLGLTRDAVSYWYAKDDITVSNAVACARALGRNLNFVFVKVRDKERMERDKIYIRSSVYTSAVWDAPEEEQK